VLAAIAREHDIHPQAIYDLVKSCSGKPADTCRNIRRQMERHLEQASELTAEELLSDEAYKTQPIVKVKGFSGCRFYVKKYGWDEIEEAEEALKEVSKVYDERPAEKSGKKRFRSVNSMRRPYDKW
jgi:hypothetical protein